MKGQKMKATEKQINYALYLLNQKGFSVQWMDAKFKLLGASMRERSGKVEDWLRNLNVADISNVIDTLTAGWVRMRTEAEIQRAHDLLIPVITGQIPNPFGKDKDAMRLLMANCDVLCWVLGHDHNKTFTKNTAALEKWLKTQGLMLPPVKDEPDSTRNE